MTWVEGRRERLKESWANAAFVSSHDAADMYQNAGAISACSVYKEVREVSAEDIFGDSDD